MQDLKFLPKARVFACINLSGWYNMAQIKAFSCSFWQLFHRFPVTTGSVATSCYSVKCWTVVWCTLHVPLTTASYAYSHDTTEGTGNTSSNSHNFGQTGAEECGTNPLFLVTVTMYLELQRKKSEKALNMCHFHHLVIANHERFIHFKYTPEEGAITLQLEVSTKTWPLCNRLNTQSHTVTAILIYVSTHARPLTYVLARLYEAAAERSVPVGLLQ